MFLFFVLYHFNAFCKFLWLRNLARDFNFEGLNFGQRIFFLVLVEALGIFWGFDFYPHSIIPATWNPECPQDWDYLDDWSNWSDWNGWDNWDDLEVWDYWNDKEDWDDWDNWGDRDDRIDLDD